MRFDDSLDTVLTAEVSNPAAIQVMWRQAVDLIGRRRGGRREGAIARLHQIRGDVPVAIRAASARGLERANPPADLAALFLVDEPAVAAPVARSARLSTNEWLALLPEMHPTTRGVLRHRRDLPERVVVALESFGPSDFALTTTGEYGHTDQTVWPPIEKEAVMNDLAAPPVANTAPAWPPTDAPLWPPAAQPEPAEPYVEPTTSRPLADAETPAAVGAEVLAADVPEARTPWPPLANQPTSLPPADVEPVEEPAVAAADAAPPVQEMPVAEPPTNPWPSAEAEPGPAFVAPDPLPFVAVADVARELPVVAEAMRREQAEASAPPPPVDQDFQIAELVARIEAHTRATPPRAEVATVLPAPEAAPTQFRFETDQHGVIRWCEGVERGPVIGLSLTAGADGAPPTTDAAAAGALARRARFGDARLVVPGTSPAAGAWRISGSPVFDHASGRFTGYRGTARRPRADEEPRALGPAPTPATDALRQLVHELRTPTNAISGFAEMIMHEMLGPVPPAYREQAVAIRDQTAGLLGAIDDLDMAARLESRSLELHAEPVQLGTLLGRIAQELDSLAAARGAALRLEVARHAVAAGDARAVERLFSRLLGALLASAASGETVGGSIAVEGDTIRCDLARPAALVAVEGPLFTADAEVEAAAAGAPLLGTGFAFRLAQRLAAELGGNITLTPDRLTLRLPAAVTSGMEQATV